VSATVEYGKCTAIPAEMAGKVSSIRRDKNNSCIELYENPDCTGASVIQRGPDGITNVLIMEVFDKKTRSISFCGYHCPPPSLPKANAQSIITLMTTKGTTTGTTEVPSKISTTKTPTTLMKPTTTTTLPTTTIIATATPSKLERSNTTTTEIPIEISDRDDLIKTEILSTETSLEIGNLNSEKPNLNVQKPDSNENELISRISKEPSDSDVVELTLGQLISIIAGVSVFVIVIVIIMLGIIFRRRNNTSEVQKQILVAPEVEILSKNEVEEFLKGGGVPSATTCDLDPGGIYSQVWSMPYNNDFEIPKESVQIG